MTWKIWLTLFLGLTIECSVWANVRIKGHSYRKTTTQEQQHFLSLSGQQSAGVLISYKYFLTAAHSCDDQGEIPGTEIRFKAKVVETHPDFDVCILEIVRFYLLTDYNKPEVPSFLPTGVSFPTRIWTEENQVQMPSSSDIASALYYVGNDVYGFAYSDGYALELGCDQCARDPDKKFVYFNIGGQQGMSGGPVYRKSDNMLISLMSGPVSGIPDGIYSPDDKRGWMLGPALFKVYQESPILQSVFPNGENIFADPEGRPRQK